MKRLVATCLVLFSSSLAAAAAPSRPLTRDGVNAAGVDDTAKPSRALLIRVETLLDRAHVSPGVIDGKPGDNLNKAVKAYRQANGLGDATAIDAETLSKLTEADPALALVTYTVTTADAKGPWTRHIPRKMEAQARLKRLGYRDAAEMLAERFHMGDDLLHELNRGKRIGKPGTELVVAGVADDRTDPSRARAIAHDKGPDGAPIDRDAEKAQKQIVTRIVVDKAAGTLQAFDSSGQRVLFAPVTVGSPEKPAPSGTLHVVRVAPNPNYTYDPDYAFKGVKAKHPFEIAPGPNNPVGSVWIALDKQGYGIHGAPNPASVGKAQSHGCIRLTNWTALQLASMVDKGVPVEFRD